jgi:hypothetical protein
VALAAAAVELEEEEASEPLLLPLPLPDGLACALVFDFAFAATGGAGFAIAGSTSDDLRASSLLTSPFGRGPILLDGPNRHSSVSCRKVLQAQVMLTW